MPSVRSLVLVHGAGSGPWVFNGWSVPGMDVVAVDLQRDLDAASASMADYSRVILNAIGAVEPPVALCGWSMGGLVAMLASLQVDPAALILLEPSVPAEVQGIDGSVRPRDGVFDPEEVYGGFPAGVLSRPESQRARGERKAGISIPRVPARTLVVTGRDFAEERGTAIAAAYGCELLSFPELSHFDLVLDPRVPSAVARFVGA